MEEIIETAKLLTCMNIVELEYQQCLIKNQDNIYKLIDKLHEMEKLYHNVIHENVLLKQDNIDLKKKNRQIEMDNNLLYFELQHYKPVMDESTSPDLSITD